MYLLDTVIISELRKRKTDTGVLRWISSQSDEQLFLSVVTLGEIERGIEKQRKLDPDFADELSVWIESLANNYADRILPVTPVIARCWGRLSARLGHDGADLLIAATALTHGLTVVTRNISHFKPAGVAVLDPFNEN
ncbi:MAG: type II toxin-antitoxin system VapC family toxin [Gammaproteobacteria bacterium]|nr:type II toxin-antitoxin system VapC family toxin [Rhodocyclaceae bacterium]MBU3910134.1 type II toxin-antitoxin system VapC family toxin [Gammaproteobacteria bacterium]MBU3990055.1 type II toxin-antitoxin system VapC family toxin [Gammaproteobacteria bacterium]MBU4006141.1 type II toxin-antitoxin system VapC family toxin [Gammaproteobacteria bacterium]MBU4022596.1 type II toxin-antitoxin system VapC family toxin [Gammaproteobacteria bacterium]